MLRSPRSREPDRAVADHETEITWIAAIGLAAAVGVACFGAAQLSLAMLRPPNGVAAFWPALGIAVGIIAALGPTARLPAAIGLTGAILLANIAAGRCLWTATVFAASNGAGALLVGWLIERHHDRRFSLDSLPRVLNFFWATMAGSAVSGIGGVTSFALFETAQATILADWLYWFVAAALGILTVAPLVIGIVRSLEAPPTRSEIVEGALILAVLACASVLSFGRPTTDWFTIMPMAMLLPLLLWPAARCTPVFAAGAVFTLTLVVVWTVSFGVGRLGDASVPLSGRLMAAQATMLCVSTCALVIGALFAERRTREAMLSGSNDRLRVQREAFCRLLGSLPVSIYTTDWAGRITYCNAAAVDLWQRRPELGKDKWFDLWTLYYPDGTRMPLDDRPSHIVLKQGRPVRGREALLERPDGTRVPIMPCPAPLIDEQGEIIGVVNMQVDLTERKKAEAALAERDALLALAGKVARVGGYTLDFASEVLSLSPGCAALYGLPEGTSEVSLGSSRQRVLPEDLAAMDAEFARACAEQRREHVARFRIAREGDGEVRWIETRSIISYDAGRPTRMVGIGIDVTESRLAEEHQRMLIAELDHRVKNVLATVSAVASRTQDESHSVAEFAATLAGRIRSMAATHELLSGGQWKGVSVRELVERELAPYATSTNTRLDGPELTLSPESAQAVSMVLHELTTNAAKHGALSSDDGRVCVSWGSGRGLVSIEWQESGGPLVRPPKRCGYGTDIIRNLIPYELDGTVDLEFRAQGVRCVVEFPASELNGTRRSDDDLVGPVEHLRPLAGDRNAVAARAN